MFDRWSHGSDHRARTEDGRLGGGRSRRPDTARHWATSDPPGHRPAARRTQMRQFCVARAQVVAAGPSRRAAQLSARCEPMSPRRRHQVSAIDPPSSNRRRGTATRRFRSGDVTESCPPSRRLAPALGRDDHSSSPAIAGGFKRPTRSIGRAVLVALLFGVAPCGVLCCHLP